MYNNIILNPEWLDKIDHSKGCYHKLSNNNLNINKLNKIININSYNSKDNKSDIDIDNDNDNDNDNDKKTINNVSLDSFPYYNETAEYIKNNAVFIKPQFQNFYAKEFEHLNNFKTRNTPLIKDTICYDDDDDFSIFNTQKKKIKKKFIISKIFDDLKILKNNDINNKNNNNKNNNNNSCNNNIMNENNINNNAIDTDSNLSSDDDTYFENMKNKKNNKKNN